MDKHSSLPAGLQLYDRTWLWHSACRSAAGGAAASLERILSQQHALTRDPDWGWLGRIDPESDLISLANAAAEPCYRQAMASQPLADTDQPQRWPALIASVSKGDSASWLHGPPVHLTGRGLPGSMSAALARRWGRRFYRGATPVGACATGLLAILAGADIVEAGNSPWAIAGAADSSLQDFLLAGFRSLGVTCGTSLPSAHCGSGGGFAPAAGAGFIALGGYQRQAEDWRLCGGMRLGDARHETRCDDPRVIQQLLSGLWTCLPHPDMIICHGTGTANGDSIECDALASGPWKDCPRLLCKPIIGHSLGANAAVELAIACHGPWRRIWKIALGFGGHMSGLALARYAA